MRWVVIFGVVAVLAVTLVLSTGLITTVQNSNEAAVADAALDCDASLGPTSSGPVGSGARDAANLTPPQRGVAGLIITIGKQRKLPPRAWQVAIQAGMTESGLRPLPGGDRDSAGIFQMRPSMGWGSLAQVIDPTYAINKFYDVLLAVPGWQQQRPGESAQDVERSAFPDRYNRWEPMAASLIGDVGQILDPTGCGQGVGNLLPPPSKAAGTAITWALRQQGDPYVWGAPVNQADSFDCSSLMLQAYRAAGIVLPRTSRDQYHAGALLPIEQAKPGDLLFWAYDTGNPATIHHVAMYLGDNKIVEAQQTGVPVHVRPIRFGEPELMSQAVRPGV